MNNQITEAHHKLSDGLEQLLKKIEVRLVRKKKNEYVLT